MTDEAQPSSSPFSKPWFLVSAVVVVAIVIVAIIMAFTSGSDVDPAPTAGASTQPSSTTDAAAPEGASVCGLDGEKLEGRLTKAPAVDSWEFQGSIAYPTSAQYGPGATSDDGVRYCFQRSPEGALFAAANAGAQASDPAVAAQFAKLSISQGPDRQQWIADLSNVEPDSSGMRISLDGFRLLSYDGSTARVDLGIRAAADGSSNHASAIYNLVWEDGDWKLDSTAGERIDWANVPNLVGYVDWGN